MKLSSDYDKFLYCWIFYYDVVSYRYIDIRRHSFYWPFTVGLRSVLVVVFSCKLIADFLAGVVTERKIFVIIRYREQEIVQWTPTLDDSWGVTASRACRRQACLVVGFRFPHLSLGLVRHSKPLILAMVCSHMEDLRTKFDRNIRTKITLGIDRQGVT